MALQQREVLAAGEDEGALGLARVRGRHFRGWAVFSCILVSPATCQVLLGHLPAAVPYRQVAQLVYCYYLPSCREVSPVVSNSWCTLLVMKQFGDVIHWCMSLRCRLRQFALAFAKKTFWRSRLIIMMLVLLGDGAWGMSDQR